MDKPLWMWGLFLGIVVALLVFDLGVMHRKTREIKAKESLLLSAFYVFISCCFGAWIWSYDGLGPEKAKEFFTGYIVELSLAMDNLFVISLIFTYFAIPKIYQHRALFWGILGVIVLRGIMIGLGAALVAEFSWVLYIFAAFLIITGVKMLWMVDHKPDIDNNPLLKYIRRHFLITKDLHAEKFFVKAPHPKTGKTVTWITPLFVALILIEFVDLIFAVDSVPAIFAITTDPFIVYTSNIFAILGLRSLYFALALMIHRFTYLKYALALVLIFIGSKIFIADLFFSETGKMPVSISLGVTFTLLAGGVIFSLIKTRGQSIKE
jgi:tellurite resistance protein TerC